MVTLMNLHEIRIDLRTDQLGWEVYDELDALIDSIYEAQQREEQPDLWPLKKAKKDFLKLWDEIKQLEETHKENEVFQRNQEVILLAVTTLWMASMTIEAFQL